MRLSREQRRALKMLADAPRGVSEEVLVIAHGFSVETLTGLVRANLRNCRDREQDRASRLEDRY